MTKPESAARLAAVALVAILATGCSIGGDHDRSATDAAQAADEAILGDHDFTLDLRKPPSREDLQMGPGGQINVHATPDGKDFKFTVVLQDGKRFTTPSAAYMNLTVTDEQGTVMVEVDEHSPTPEAVVRKRLSALRGLGLSAAQEAEAIRSFTKPESATQTRAYQWSLGRPGKAQIVVKLIVGDQHTGKARALVMGYEISKVRLTAPK